MVYQELYSERAVVLRQESSVAADQPRDRGEGPNPDIIKQTDLVAADVFVLLTNALT